MTRLTRSMLFVPAGRPPMIEKAAASAADAVCIDLEDSVPLEQKAEARGNAIRAFRELDFGRRVRMLRVNALDTPFAWRDLTEVVAAAADRIDLVMLPKTGRPRRAFFTPAKSRSPRRGSRRSSSDRAITPPRCACLPHRSASSTSTMRFTRAIGGTP
jgi:citrate lyase beta subunit